MSEPVRYRLLSSLGKGGMGEVFLADDTQLGRKVAIKFLTEALENDASARERLHREARSAAALDHPFICKIHEIADVDGRTGIVMEHVSGETLHATLIRGPLAPGRALEVASEIAEALDEAHTRKLVHRDLKPANVMLTEQGHVKVMDFGLAKAVAADATAVPDAETQMPLTGSGVRVGTPGYMAPELLLGADADARSDIFAFGLLLYELLAGTHPFHRTSQSGTMAAILRDAAPPVSQYQSALPPAATATLDRMLAKAPDQRFQSVADVHQALRGLLDEVTGATPSGVGAAAIVSPETKGPPRTPYVGREQERGQARLLLEQVVAGQGAALLLGGEPGVGKTRFTEELIREARERGCLTLVGHCYETEGHPPYIPFVEMLDRASKIVPRPAFREALGDAAPEVAKIAPELRRVFPDIPPPIELPPDQQRRYLFSAYQAFTERAVGVMPNVLVLEDLHWADEPTVLLMQHLAQHAAALPLLLVGTYRDVELDVGRPWATVMASLLRERLATRIALRRLPESDIEALLAALGGPDPPAVLSRAVFHETEGNPFFVEEVFQHLQEEGRLFDDGGAWRTDLDTGELQVPEGVRLVIGRRLERVSDDTRKALTVAAVIGRSFELAVLEAAARLDPDDLLDGLEEAERAQLVTSAASGREVRYTFSHELIRQTLQQNLSLPRRQRIHLRVAEAIEAASVDDTARHTPTLAHHCYQAGSLADADRTLGYLTTAGRQALASAAFEDAVEHFTKALSFDRLGPTQRAELLFERGVALRSLAQADDAIVDWQAALGAYEAAGDASGVARAAWELGWMFLYQNRAPDALAVAQRAEPLVPDVVSPDRARVLAIWGLSRAWMGDYATFLRRTGEARLIAEQLGESRLLGHVLGMQATGYRLFARVRDAAEVGRDAVAASRAAEDVWELASAISMLGFPLLFGGEPENAYRVADEAAQLGADIGSDLAVGNAAVVRGQATWALGGDLDAIDRIAEDGIDAFKHTPWRWAGEVIRSRVQFWRGAWDTAERYWDEALARVTPEPIFGEHAHAWRYVLRAYRGDRSWLEEFRHRRDAILRDGRTLFEGDVHFLILTTVALAVLGEKEEAARLYAPTRTVLEYGFLCNDTLTDMSVGIAAASGQQWATATTHFETALHQAHQMPHRIAQPEVRRWYAWMLLDRDAPGDREKARVLLGEASEMYKSIGMPKHVEIAERMLEDA